MKILQNKIFVTIIILTGMLFIVLYFEKYDFYQNFIQLVTKYDRINLSNQQKSYNKKTNSGFKAEERNNFSKININNADIYKIAKLPGIGLKIAGKIVKYREKYGTFQSPDDLIKINGIGPKKLKEVLKYVTVR